MDKGLKENILQWIFIALIIIGIILVCIGVTGCQRNKDVVQSMKLCQTQCLERNSSYENYFIIHTNTSSYELKCVCNTYASGDYK